MNFFEKIWQKFSFAEDINFVSIIWAVVKIALVIVAAHLLIRIINKIIRTTLERKAAKHPDSAYEKKQHTLITLFQSITKYGVYFFMIICLLAILGLGSTVGSVIATAGIGGIALSLGAQSLIADIVAGFFNLFEDSFAVGDYIKLPTAALEGTVESVSLRTTRLKLVNGETAIINNGTLGTIINYTRNSYKLILDYSIAGDEDDAKASEVLKNTLTAYFEKMGYDPETIVYAGIAAFTPLKKTLRILGEVPPLQQWQAQRDLNKAVLSAFAEAGIRPPEYPEKVILTSL